MSLVDIVSITFGAVGIVAAIWFYYHLWKWGRDCQQATVAIAWKRKVVLSPTLVELVLWSRKVPKDQNGQVFYRNGGFTVAIIKREKRSLLTRKRIRKNVAQAESRVGTWSSKDQTAKVNSARN